MGKSSIGFIKSHLLKMFSQVYDSYVIILIYVLGTYIHTGIF